MTQRNIMAQEMISIEEKIRTESGISFKERDSFHITNLDIEPDMELALNRIQRRLLRTNLIVDGLDITLSGNKIAVKKSKTGYMYFILNEIYVKGSLRKEIMNRLYNQSKVIGYIKLGKYEIRKCMLQNEYEMYFWFNLREPRGVEYVTNFDAVVASYRKISDDVWSMPEVFDVYRTNTEDEDEPIYDKNGLGYLKIENYLDKLEVIKELISEIKEYENEPEVKESLDELRDMLEE